MQKAFAMPNPAAAESLLQRDAYQMNEDGTALLRPIENPAPDGYDVGGRYAISHTSVMPTLALAYRLRALRIFIHELVAQSVYYDQTRQM